MIDPGVSMRATMFAGNVKGYGSIDGRVAGGSRARPWRSSVMSIPVKVVGLVALACVLFVASRGTTPTSEMRSALPDAGSSQKICDGGVCVYASNDYERRLGRAIANGLYDGGIILELYQLTHVVVVGADVCEMESSRGLDIVESGDCEWDMMATDFGPYFLSTRSEGDDRVVVVKFVGKYVRRELRDLTAADRTRYLDAIAVTHKTPNDEGFRLYGERYKSAEWFAATHGMYSTKRFCDSWHSGAGFLNQHMSFTLRFEQSLQSIDPRTCVHYWDFTIDYARIDHWEESVMWSPDWFSTVHPNNTLHIVDSGRWAYLPLYRSTFPSRVKNAYGYLNVPWNTDPTPFVTRSQYIYGLRNYINIPSFGCAKFLKSVVEDTANYASAMRELGNDLHSPVHGMVGGYWNYEPNLIESQSEFNKKMYNVSSASNAISKKMWRMGIIECPHFCSEDTPPIACNCELATQRVEKHYPNYTAYDFLNVSGAFSQYEQMTSNNFDYSDTNATIWGLVFKQLVNVGHVGSADNDASPVDPIFWTIHGMQERFMQMIRYLNDTGKMNFDQTWANEGATNYFDWSNVTRWSDIPYHNKSGLCAGHHKHDLIIYPHLLLNQPTDYITNIEYYNFTSAFSPHLPYVYDQLLNWTECGWIFGANTSSKTFTY